MTQTRFDYGGEGPPIHMAVANGFPPQTYTPMLEPLTVDYTIFSLPPRPLWRPTPPPETAPTWATMAEDILAGLASHGANRVIGVGHSMGAIATIIAAVTKPQCFRGIILLDPTVFQQRQLTVAWAMRQVGLKWRLPLVQRAVQRQSAFDSREAAFDYWRGKRLFTDWDDMALHHYVDGLTEPDEAGGIRLAWAPTWEAHYYATIFAASWRYIRQLSVPVLTIRGTTSNTFLEPAAAKMQRSLPEMTYAEIEGHGHLFPQSAPDETRAIIQRWLTSLEG